MDKHTSITQVKQNIIKCMEYSIQTINKSSFELLLSIYNFNENIYDGVLLLEYVVFSNNDEFFVIALLNAGVRFTILSCGIPLLAFSSQNYNITAMLFSKMKTHGIQTKLPFPKVVSCDLGSLKMLVAHGIFLKKSFEEKRFLSMRSLGKNNLIELIENFPLPLRSLCIMKLLEMDWETKIDSYKNGACVS